MLPVLLNLTDRLVCVVGAGKVGRRKVRLLLDSGCRVRLIDAEPQLEEFHSPHLEWIVSEWKPEHFAGAELIFAAVNPEEDRKILAEGRRLGIRVNCADDPSEGDFYLPAVVRQGDLQIAISTGGASPAVAKLIREMLEKQFDEVWGEWLSLLKEIRPLVLSQIEDAGKRETILKGLAEVNWLEMLRQQGREVVRAAMLVEVRNVG